MYTKLSSCVVTSGIRSAVQKRYQSVVSGPPTKHVSTTEKIILGGGMCVASLFIPAWVLCHIRDYKGAK